MTQLTVEFARPSDDSAIRSLMRRAHVPGRVTVTFEREPNFSLGCAVSGDCYRILVAREALSGEVVGVACRSVRYVFINGCPQRVGYLGQLRIAEEYRGHWLVARGFSLLAQLHRDDPLPAYLVSIVDENRLATGVLIDKRRKSFPAFHRVSDFVTLAIDVSSLRGKSSTDIEIKAGAPELIGSIAQFLREQGSRRQFFPVWDEKRLSGLAALGLRTEDIRIAVRDRNLVGVMALWDQSAYKQTVVRNYSGWLKVGLPLFNRTAPWFGRNPLPLPGQRLRSAYVALICVANDDAEIFSALLRSIQALAEQQGIKHLLLGLSPQDALMARARKYRHIRYPNTFYLAEWSDGAHLHEQLDERPAYIDIATL
jgi:hypothetical protein